MVRSASLFTIAAASVIGLGHGLTYMEPKVTLKGACVDPKTGVQPQVCKHAIAGLSSVSNVRDAVKMFEYKKECEAYGEKLEAKEWDCEIDVQMRVFLFGIRDRCILLAGWEIPVELRELGFVTENYIYTNLDFNKKDFPKDKEGSLIFRRAFYDAWKPYDQLTTDERAEAQDHCLDTNYGYQDTFIVYKTKPEENITYNDLLGTVTLSRYEVREPETYLPMPYRKQSGLWGNFVLADSYGDYQEINGVPTGKDRTYIAIDLSLYDPSKDDSVTTSSTEAGQEDEVTATNPATTAPNQDDKGKGAAANLGLATAAVALFATAGLASY